VAELLRYLGECGLKPGMEFVVADVAPLDGSLMLTMNKRHLALSPQIAEYVWVRKSGRREKKKSQ
jgi:Fe2+ transport system protein FeoA